MTRSVLVSSCLLLLALCAVPPLSAHDEPNSTYFDLLVPGDAWNGQISFVTLIGPPAGEEILHTTFDITFFSAVGGTPASEVVLELQMPVDGTLKTWVVHGTDFGWPAANGTFSATLDSDELNGVLNGGLFGFATPELTIGAVKGGLTGQYINSTIALELKGKVCQTDLGFAGPGAVSLAICGDALATGESAMLSVAGAPAFAPVFLAVGLNAAPTPFKGGTLAPLPLLLVLPFNADGAGKLRLLVPGGDGPVTLVVQAIVSDVAQPAGFALSNALQVELLP